LQKCYFCKKFTYYIIMQNVIFCKTMFFYYGVAFLGKNRYKMRTVVMKDEKHHFELYFSVRDYECDLQGIVNNAVYLHYLEHTRHEFLKSIGLDFFVLHKQGIDAVVTRLEIDYKFPLKSGDRFVVTLNLKKKGRLRYIFLQNIYSLPEHQDIISAQVICTCLYNGKPVVSEEIDRAAARFLQNE